MIEAQDEVTYCFKPAVPDQCYPCGLDLVFIFAISLVFACCFITYYFS